MSFIPLHIYSTYSFLKSSLMVKRIIGYARKFSYEGVGISDLESMTAYPELDQYSKIGNIKPVYGLDVKIGETVYSLYLKNETGYINLIKINLEASKENLNEEYLFSHLEGLTLVLPLETSPLLPLLRRKDEDNAIDYLKRKFAAIEDFYIGIPYFKTDLGPIEYLREFVKKYPYKTIAFPHIQYEKEDDAITLSILNAIEKGETLEDKQAKGNNYFLPMEAISSFYLEEEIKATEEILNSIDFTFSKKRGGLLHFPCPDNLSKEEYLHKLTYEGLEKKAPNHDKTYLDRIEYELSIINEMGYADYFLIVQDYVKKARKLGIYVGPGRGSGAGSLVSFCLDIVKPDPIKHNLMFERFLNPERKSMPDIDVDFSDVRREEIVHYLQQKYGAEKVAHIITINTIGARQSLRDIGRVYGYDNRVIDLLSKAIEDPRRSLVENYKLNGELKRLVDSDIYYKEIVSLARKIEGLARHSGLHAAGVVLNDLPLEEAIPNRYDKEVGSICSYEMNYLEKQGFLKMDLLGLRNLTIVENCINAIKANGGPSLDYQTLPYEDPKAIALIASGKTMGLFQLESSGMREAILEVKPEKFEDVVALLALYRPGPMDNIPTFAAVKHGLQKPNYLSPELEEILSPTYGVIVYQEQIIQIVKAMTGCSYGHGDSVMKAIKKKDSAALSSIKPWFIEASLAKGHDKNTSEKVWGLIYRFADYGFNKAHAVSYGMLTCQMAYLKAYYPAEYYASVLDYGDNSKFSQILSELKKAGISISLPYINEASYHFVVKDNKLLFPFSYIKGVNLNFAMDIVEERENHGEFLDVPDFVRRMTPFGLTAQYLAKFIDAGCFDKLYKSRASLRSAVGQLLQYGAMFYNEHGGESLLGVDIPKPYIPVCKDYLEQDLSSEKEALGMMISGSPLSLYQDSLSKLEYTPLADIEVEKGEFTTLAVIKSIKVIISKKTQKTVAFASVYDDYSEAEFTIFSNEYDAYYPLLKKDKVVLITARKDRKGNDRYIVISIKEANS